MVYCLTLLASTWLLVRAWPHEVGLQPDGAPANGAGGNGEPAGLPPGTSFERAVRSRFFVFTAVGFVLVMGSQIGAIQHIYKLTGDRLGLEAAATGAVSVLAATSVVARICGGIAAIKVSLRWLTMSLMAVQCIGMWLLAEADSGLAILFGVIVLGSAMGNLLMLHPLILADAFGVRDYPRIYGFGSLLMVIGGAGGPITVGVLRDAFSYRSSFFTLAVIAAVGLAVYSFGGNPTRDYLAAPPPESEWAPPLRPRAEKPTPLPTLTIDRDRPNGEHVAMPAANGPSDGMPEAGDADGPSRKTAPAVWTVESA